jgi:hypothetical protein
MWSEMWLSSVACLLLLSLFIKIGDCLECKRNPEKNFLWEGTIKSGHYFKFLDFSDCGNDRLEIDEGFKDRDFLKADKNAFSELEANTFVKISNLLIIDLHDNQIKEISREAFTGLSKLTRLYLNYNLIEELKVGTFDPLIALEALKLQHNKIKVLMEGIFDKNLNLDYSNFDQNQIFAVGPTVLKPGKEWNLIGNKCVNKDFPMNDNNLEQGTIECVGNYEILREIFSEKSNFGDAETQLVDNVQDRIQINDLATTENFKLNFLSIILAGLFTISLLLNVIQFVRTKRVTQAQATIPSPANEPVTYYLTMNAETVGARSVSLRPNNDRVEESVCDNGEEHVYDVLKE